MDTPTGEPLVKWVMGELQLFSPSYQDPPALQYRQYDLSRGPTVPRDRQGKAHSLGTSTRRVFML
jgi:hypothetical protein